MGLKPNETATKWATLYGIFVFALVSVTWLTANVAHGAYFADDAAFEDKHCGVVKDKCGAVPTSCTKGCKAYPNCDCKG